LNKWKGKGIIVSNLDIEKTKKFIHSTLI